MKIMKFLNTLLALFKLVIANERGAIDLLGEAGMTNEMKQFYDRKLLDVARLNLIFVNAGEKRPIPPRGGKSIEFRRFEKFTVTAGSYTLTEGTPPTVSNGTVSNVAATISQYGQFAQLSDVLETQSFDPVIAEYTDKFGIAMAEGLDLVVRNALSSATTVQYAGAATVVGTSGLGAVGSGQWLNATELLEFKRTLRRNSTKGQIKCFIHPDNTKDLFEDPDIAQTFREAADRGANNPMITGQLGRWNGIDFIETENLRLRSSYGMSGADVYEVVMFGDGFYGVSELSALNARVIVHPRGSGGHTDPLEQYSTIGWKAALATTILNNNFGGIIYVSSSRSAA